MEIFFAWASFIGSWLLVAGSMYQAVLELKDEDIERDRFSDVQANVTPPPKVSPWWWLIPPLKIIKEQKRSREYRHAYFSAMTDEDAQAFLSFTNKATAWLFVAGGSTLLALQETYSLMKPKHVSDIILFIIVLVVLFIASILNTVFRITRSNGILEKTSHKEKSSSVK